MANDPLDAFDMMMEFPYSSGSFGEVRRYIRAIKQFSEFPSTQTVTRLKARLRKTIDPVRRGELQYEIEVAELDAKFTVPRIIWGSILVAIYATFETGVKNALSHWANNVPGAAEFKVNGKGEFLKIAAAYSEAEVGAVLFPDSDLKEAVLELKAFRNSFAHSAGQLPPGRSQLHVSIERATKRGLAVTVEGQTWGATPGLAVYYFLRAERSYELFASAVVRKYVSVISSVR